MFANMSITAVPSIGFGTVDRFKDKSNWSGHTKKNSAQLLLWLFWWLLYSFSGTSSCFGTLYTLRFFYRTQQCFADFLTAVRSSIDLTKKLLKFYGFSLKILRLYGFSVKYDELFVDFWQFSLPNTSAVRKSVKNYRTGKLKSKCVHDQYFRQSGHFLSQPTPLTPWTWLKWKMPDWWKYWPV